MTRPDHGRPRPITTDRPTKGERTMYWLYFTRADGRLICAGSHTSYRTAVASARALVRDNGCRVSRIVRVEGERFASVVRFYCDPCNPSGYATHWGPARGSYTLD